MWLSAWEQREGTSQWLGSESRRGTLTWRLPNIPKGLTEAYREIMILVRLTPEECCLP